MDDVCENIDDYNLNRKRKVLIVFDDMIADIMANKKFQSIIKELFIRCRKLNILLVFITQSYFSVPKDVRLNSTHCLIMEINNRKELQNIAINHSADIDYKDFIKIYKECIKEPYNTLTDNPSIKIYSNKIKNRIVFKIKNGYKLELLTPETMKLLGSTKKIVDKDENSENVPKLKSVEVALVHCNLVKNDFQHASKVLFSFVPNKQFGQLLNISPHVFTMMNTVNT